MHFSTQASLRTVSYTHLDVYKRQPYPSLREKLLLCHCRVCRQETIAGPPGRIFPFQRGEQSNKSPLAPLFQRGETVKSPPFLKGGNRQISPFSKGGAGGFRAPLQDFQKPPCPSITSLSLGQIFILSFRAQRRIVSGANSIVHNLLVLS